MPVQPATILQSSCPLQQTLRSHRTRSHRLLGQLPPVFLIGDGKPELFTAGTKALDGHEPRQVVSASAILD